ncbi:MAG: VWA domain-containing protein [Phycisphaerales bacterium]|nr:VWA domain-containing protein [Phycisphaerales bacterium]
MLNLNWRRRMNAMAGAALALALGVGGASPAFGQQAHPEPWAPNVVLPQSRVIVAPDHQQPIQLSSVEADVQIVEQVATVSLRLTLQNPSSRVQEAEIVLPVPEESAVRYFQLEGVGGDGGARLLPRDEARRIYEEIVRRMQDPAILEFAGYGFIRSNVFPVPAQGSQVIVLTYEQMLPASGMRLDFVLPKTQSLDDAGIRWSISGAIRSKRPITTIYSPSHDIALTREGDTARFNVTDPRTPGSFVLSAVMGGSADEPSATLIACPDPKLAQSGQSGYFMFLAGLPALPDGARSTIRREVTIVLDRSGSMRGEKIEQAKSAALQVIEGLRPDEHFNVIDYSDSIQSFADRPVLKTEDAVRRARAYIANIQAIGGTNIHDALIEALRQEPVAGTLPVVLFLTDGLPTIGATRESAIREAAAKANVHQRRVFTFGVGFDVNAPLLTAIARQSRATSSFVRPDEDVEVKVGQVFARLSGPVLASPRVVFSGPGADQRVRELLPAELPDVFEGDQITLLGQYFGEGPITAKLEGNYLGRAQTFEFSFSLADASTRHAFVPRLWATRRIGTLIEQIRLAGADSGLPTSRPRPVDPRFQELVDEIVRLSTEFGVLTEYTAFLADEAALEDLHREIAAGGGRGGAPMPTAPGDAAHGLTGYSLRERAQNDRSGAGGVNQDMNLGVQVLADKAYAKNGFVDEEMQWRDVDGCQVAGDKALFRRGRAWIDGRIVAQDQQDPEETCDFGSERYFEIVRALAQENRQSLLCNRGDALVLVGGKRVLVRYPG